MWTVHINASQGGRQREWARRIMHLLFHQQSLTGLSWSLPCFHAYLGPESRDRQLADAERSWTSRLESVKKCFQMEMEYSLHKCSISEHLIRLTNPHPGYTYWYQHQASVRWLRSAVCVAILQKISGTEYIFWLIMKHEITVYNVRRTMSQFSRGQTPRRHKNWIINDSTQCVDASASCLRAESDRNKVENEQQHKEEHGVGKWRRQTKEARDGIALWA